MSAGTYMLRVGSFFYLGSSGNFTRRRHAHRSDLKRGVHPNQAIQSAYSPGATIEFITLEYIPRAEGEELGDYSTRLRNAEQMLLDRYAKDPHLCNKSTNAFGPDNSDFMKSRWADPEYRNHMLAKMRECRGPVTEKSRRLMSEAKKGRRNVRSRQVIVTDPDGIEMEFDSVTAVAKFFNVTQQLMDSWMSGKVKWPAPNKGWLRNRWIAAYQARYVGATPVEGAGEK